MRIRKFLQPGETFGEWTVVAFSHLDGTRDMYDCRCSCGRVATVQKRHLRTGASSRCKSCASSSHRQSRTSLYKLWMTMIARCHRPTSSGFPRYGARGILVCERWRTDFSAFAADVGERPSAGHSLDRIDNSRGYEPGNVRWATNSEQSRNRRSTRFVTLDGETRCVAEWCRITGINTQTVHERLRRGWEERRSILPHPGGT